MTFLRRLRHISLCLGLLWVSGCAAAGARLYKDLQAEDPAVRIQAVVRAGQIKDQGAVPYLVDRLTDSEVDVRLFAIVSLEKITGQRMGYHIYDPPAKRAEAVDRWRQWLATRHASQAATSQPEVAQKP